MLHVLMREQAGKGVLVEVGKGRFMLPEQGGRGGRNGDNRGGMGRKDGDRPSMETWSPARSRSPSMARAS